MSPDTLKDTCPHQVQCATQEECDSKADPSSAASLGERLVVAELQKQPATRHLVVVVKEGAALWRYTASYASLDRAHTTTGTMPTRYGAHRAAMGWLEAQLVEDGELPSASIPPPEEQPQLPLGEDFVPMQRVPTFEELKDLLHRVNVGLSEQAFRQWGELERLRVERWAHSKRAGHNTHPAPECMLVEGVHF